jgi:GDPmannose 4,6-dehydratase
LGNLDAQRDWGFAKDYVHAMWLMLQQDRADDFVIATGISHSVRELIEIAFSRADLDWRKYVRADPALVRPAEVDHLLGDASKARAQLGWKPTVDFKALVELMVDADLRRLEAAAARVAER